MIDVERLGSRFFSPPCNSRQFVSQIEGRVLVLVLVRSFRIIAKRTVSRLAKN